MEELHEKQNQNVKKMTNEKAGNSKKGNGTPQAVQKLTFFLNHIYKLKSFTHIFYHNSVQKKNS